MILRRSAGISKPKKGGRKLGRKVAVVAAAAGLAALTACSSSGSSGSTLSGVGTTGLYGSIPAASGTPHTGTIKIAQLTGMTPWILPMVTAADNSIYTTSFFDYLMWRPLYYFPNGTSQVEDKQLSLANDPTWSNGDKTATVTLKSNYKWSDGQAVTSKDVAFWYYELAASIKESAANWAYYVPGLGFPDQVASVTTPNASTVVFNLKSAANPSWFLDDELSLVQPMPAHSWAQGMDFTNPANAKKIYDTLSKASGQVSTYASNPLWQTVDGPYKLTSFNTSSDDWAMSPNKAYSGPTGKAVSPIQLNFYTSEPAEFNAIKAGDADVGFVPMVDVPQASSLNSSYSLFGYPGLGFHAIFYNFKDTTNAWDKVIGQLYIRQAIAHLDDEQGVIHAIYHGAGAPEYGPVGKYPTVPATPANALTDPYPYSPTTAANILKAHGWNVVPNGVTTCAKPGSAANECGAGIPAGTKLAWNMPYAADNTTSTEMATIFASALKPVGMEVTLKSSTFQSIITNDNDVAVPKNDNSWAMELFGGEGLQVYPTTFGLFNSTGSGNIGGYDDPQADKLITGSVAGSNPSALTAELSYLTQQQPVYFEPSEDYASAGGLLAINKQVSGDPNTFAAYTQDFLLPEFWYFKK
ncbi:MAG TPA: ABC transporter substrate-binding protein [Trebonia sp.]